MEYYSAMKKNKIMPSAAVWMDLEAVLLREVARQRDEYHVVSLTWDKLKFVIHIYMLLLLLLLVASDMSDSVRCHRGQPSRLPCPWDSPGKNTGVGCHFLLYKCSVQFSSVQSLDSVQLFGTP